MISQWSYLVCVLLVRRAAGMEVEVLEAAQARTMEVVRTQHQGVWGVDWHFLSQPAWRWHGWLSDVREDARSLEDDPDNAHVFGVERLPILPLKVQPTHVFRKGRRTSVPEGIRSTPPGVEPKLLRLLEPRRPYSFEIREYISA
jgi:hypothetical protein